MHTIKCGSNGRHVLEKTLSSDHFCYICAVLLGQSWTNCKITFWGFIETTICPVKVKAPQHNSCGCKTTGVGAKQPPRSLFVSFLAIDRQYLVEGLGEQD